MKKKAFFSLAGLIILVILGAIFFVPKKIEHGMKNPGKNISVTKQDSGKEIAANAGDTIQVELEGAGATGYWWYPDNLDADHLQLISEDTRTNSSDNKAGAPVIGIWKFKTLKAGQSAIKMDYYRVWEGVGSATDHFNIGLQVK